MNSWIRIVKKEMLGENGTLPMRVDLELMGNEPNRLYKGEVVVRIGKLEAKVHIEFDTEEQLEWETPLCYWSNVPKPGYKYSEKKKAWWKRK